MRPEEHARARHRHRDRRGRPGQHRPARADAPRPSTSATAAHVAAAAVACPLGNDGPCSTCSGGASGRTRPTADLDGVRQRELPADDHDENSATLHRRHRITAYSGHSDRRDHDADRGARQGDPSEHPQRRGGVVRRRPPVTAWSTWTTPLPSRIIATNTPKTTPSTATATRASVSASPVTAFGSSRARRNRRPRPRSSRREPTSRETSPAGSACGMARTTNVHTTPTTTPIATRMTSSINAAPRGPRFAGTMRPPFRRLPDPLNRETRDCPSRRLIR